MRRSGPAPISMDRRGKCTICHIPMVKAGKFYDCEKCGRTMHEVEVRRMRAR